MTKLVNSSTPLRRLHNLTGATWARDANGRAYNTPTLGDDLIANGVLEAAYVLGVANGWVEVDVSLVGTPTEETSDVYAGASSQKYVRSGAGTIPRLGSTLGATVVTGTHYQFEYALKVAAGGVKPLLRNAAVIGAGTVLNYDRAVSPAAWTLGVDTGRAISTALHPEFLANSDPTTFLLDGVTVKALTTSELISTVTAFANNLTATASIRAMTTGSWAGAVACWDGTNNGLFAYQNGATVYLDKVVGGTWTNLLTVTVAFVADAKIEIRRPSGNTYQLWYNGAQRGTDQTVSDAGIISNTRYGLFSTYSGNTFSEFTLGGSIIPFTF